MEGFRMNQLARFRKVIIKPPPSYSIFLTKKGLINIVSKFLIINI